MCSSTVEGSSAASRGSAIVVGIGTVSAVAPVGEVDVGEGGTSEIAQSSPPGGNVKRELLEVMFETTDFTFLRQQLSIWCWIPQNEQVVLYAEHAEARASGVALAP